MAGRFSLEAVFKGTDRFSPMLGAVQARTSRFATGIGSTLNSTNSALDRFGERLKAVGFAAAGLGAVAGVGLAHIATAGMGFEHEITRVGAVMGKTRAQIGDLEKEAMHLGVVTQFSSSEVAQAMETLARKGFDSQEILQGIPGVLNAIAASGEGMAEVAQVVGASIRGFGLEASKASHVADVLAFTSEKVGAHITDMGTALAIAAPTAKTLGVSIEDTAAAVGLLQKIGLDASTAGTATATMLAKISKPSKDAAEQMAAMGIKFDDAKGNMLAFRDVLGQFIKAGDKAGGNMKRMAFLAELVGLRGDKAAIGLADMAKSGEFDRLAEGLKKVDGYAAFVAGLNLDDSTGSLKLFTSTIEVLADRLWGLKSNALRGVVDGTNKWLGANQELIISGVDRFLERSIPLVRDFGAGFSRGFRDVISPLHVVTDGVDGLLRIIPGLGTAASNGERLGKLAGSLLLVAGGVKAVTFAMGAFNAVADASPYTLLLGAVVGLGTAYVMFAPEIDAFARRHKVLLGVVAGGVTIVAGAYVWTNAWKGAVLALEIAQKGAAAATWIVNGARGALAVTTRAAGVAETLFTGEVTAAAVATDGAAASFVAADLALAPFLLSLGAAGLAVGALVMQLQGLEKETGGHIWEGVKGVFTGRGFAGGVDDAMNEDARRKFAAERPALGGAPLGLGAPLGPPPLPGAPPPSADGAAPPAPGPVDSAALMQLITALQKQQAQQLEVTVKADPGTKADVKQPNAGSKRPIKLTNSGSTSR